MGVETRRELQSPRGRGFLLPAGSAHSEDQRPNLAEQLNSIVAPAGISGAPLHATEPPAPVPPFPRPPPDMPSSKVMQEAASRHRAASLAQTYMPVSRRELRNIVRNGHQNLHQPMISPRQPLQGFSRENESRNRSEKITLVRSGNGRAAITESRGTRPQSAMAPASGSHQTAAQSQAYTAAANARNIVRCYEMYVSQGTDPQIALHAARAHAVSIQQRIQQQQRDADRATRQILGMKRRQLTHAAGPSAAQPAPAPEPAAVRSTRPSSAAVGTPRPSTASKERSGGAGPKDQLFPFGYQTLGPIAAGAFTMVRRARHLQTGEEVAVKTFLMRAKGGRRPDLETVQSELSCLMKLRPSSHPAIANLIETHEGQYETHAILQLGGGGSLLRLLQSQRHGTGLDERTSVSYVGQIASALAHMHELGVTHRDVKPGNVVFDDNSRKNVKLVDFGFAKSHRVEPSANAAPGPNVFRRFKTQCGTPAYMAPEVIRGNAYFGPPVDCWALGVFLYELLHNRPPFRAQTIQDLNVRIMKCSFDAFAKHVSKGSQAFMRRCMAVEVGERLHAKDAQRLACEIADRASARAELAGAPAPASEQLDRVARDW